MRDKDVRQLLAWLLLATFPAMVGCAESGTATSWMPWGRDNSQVAGIASPSQRISDLKALADQAGKKSPDEKQRISEQLASAIRNEGDPLIRAELIRTLGAYPTPTADAVLRAALGDPDTDVRVAACGAWSRRGSSEAIQLLGDTLRGDTDTDVRLAAARALGQTGDQSAVAPLGDALADKDPAIQYRAVLALREVTGKDFGNDVTRWQQYARGEVPAAEPSTSIAERVRNWF